MNYPEQNVREVASLQDMASPNWENVPHAQKAAQQAVKMEGALRMVLLFHSQPPWDQEKKNDWLLFQSMAGRERADIEATTKILCNTIREVLGLAEESH